MTDKCIEHGLTFVLHISFMDLVPNWLTGALLHRVPLLERWQHRWEHRLTKSGRLSLLFAITTLYLWYTLMFMAMFGLGVACTATRGCWHWESAMWIASFSYAQVGLALRLWLWAARHYPQLYARSPVMLKMVRFYWAHFNFSGTAAWSSAP